MSGVQTMQRRLEKKLSWAFIPFFFATQLAAAGVPALNLAELVDAADLIVVGRVQGVREISSDVMEVYGQRIPCKIMEGELMVDKMLKGSSTDKISFHYTLPVTPAGGIGYQSVPNQRYRLLLLKKSEGDYQLASPYYPSFPAVVGTPDERGPAFSKVVSEIAGVIDSPGSSTEEKLQALFASRGVTNRVLTVALQRALPTEDKTLEMSVAAALLERDDLSALPIAESALAQPRSNLPAYLFENLSSAIAKGVRDGRAVPTLGRILERAPDVYARRAAASALRNVGTWPAVTPLSKALKDNDSEVRYLAVIALAEITGQPDFRPLPEEFSAHEDRYLRHWTQWATSQVGPQ